MTRVTLTFDNGPDPEITPQVLDVLRERAVTAHFFVLGQHVATPQGRKVVERACEEGHFVGNHSYTHRTPLGEDPRPDAVERELAATDALLAPLLAKYPGQSAHAAARRFRPFGGGGLIGPHLLSPSAVDYLVAHRQSCVLWSSVPRDWVDPEGWMPRALADCAARDHTALVLHDLPDASLAGLRGFIDEARGRGWELVPELPADCLPIVDGRVVADLEGLVARAR